MYIIRQQMYEFQYTIYVIISTIIEIALCVQFLQKAKYVNTGPIKNYCKQVLIQKFLFYEVHMYIFILDRFMSDAAATTNFGDAPVRAFIKLFNDISCDVTNRYFCGLLDRPKTIEAGTYTVTLKQRCLFQHPYYTKVRVKSFIFIFD